MRAARLKGLFWNFILLLMLFFSFILSLAVGSSSIGPVELVKGLLQGGSTLERNILFDIRLPRAILGLSVGGSLGLAGAILQGLFRNPLVEPYTMGISGGAALGLSLCFFFQINTIIGLAALPLSGFIGSASVIFLLYYTGMRRQRLDIQSILLTGVMISFMSSSFMMLIMSLSKLENIEKIVFWMMGSLEQPEFWLTAAALMVSVITLLVSLFYTRDLNALALGEEEAIHLGINAELSKRVLYILASILTGISVSVAGLIGFVGLVIPHLARSLVGRDHRLLLPASFIGGAAFLILSDTVARSIIAPLELPVGVITGIIGGGVFIYILSARKVRL